MNFIINVLLTIQRKKLPFFKYLLEVHSVYSLSERHARDLVVKCLLNHTSVLDVRLVLGALEESQGVLAPVDIVTFGEVISRMGTAGLFSVFCGKHGHLGLYHEVIKLHCLNQVSVPDAASVGNADVLNLLGNLVQRLAAQLKIILTTEDSSVSLHSLLHCSSDFGGRLLTSRESACIQTVYGLLT